MKDKLQELLDSTDSEALERNEKIACGIMYAIFALLRLGDTEALGRVLDVTCEVSIVAMNSKKLQIQMMGGKVEK